MKEGPILFNGPMVNAVLDGSKRQTRRLVKGFALELLQPDCFTPEYVALPENGLSPFGFVGDRLWVRETYFAYGRWETRFSAKKGRDEWHFIDMTVECDRIYQHAAANPDVPASPHRASALPGWWKRPAIFMPRAACRLVLEVTGVRVERLDGISDEDCIAEGIGLNGSAAGVPMTVPASETLPRAMYRDLWESIYGIRSWSENPWVWVGGFKPVDGAEGA